MQLINKKWMFLLGVMATILLGSTNAATAGITSSASDYFKEFPWIGLVSNKITYGPITVSHVDIHDGDKLAIVSAGETLKGSLKYKIRSKDKNMYHLYHLVIGIKGEGAQDCLAHTVNVWDSKGRANFTLVAPTKKGVYEVRFLFAEALTCQGARDLWDSGEEEPSSKATVGIIIVE